MMENNNVLLSSLLPGDSFKGKNGGEYILWFFGKNRNAAVLRKDLLPNDMRFGENNNFDGSIVETYLNSTYLREIEDEFGEDNIVEHDVDLWSLDGLRDYGVIKRKVSIPTIDLYRLHRDTFGQNKPRAFWLSTPNSTPSGYGAVGVRCVDRIGDVGYDWLRYGLAVLPFFILKSSISVSLLHRFEE